MTHVRIGMTMPVMEPDLDAEMLHSWATTIDDGPFSSLCWGERIAFDNPECLTFLGALAAWTRRVPLVMTVVVPQLHDPVMLAKSLATGDMLSGGRLTVALGVGGRHEDYRAVGADPSTQTMRQLADRAETMKRVWAGEKLTESVLPVRYCMSGPPGRRRFVARLIGRTESPESPLISMPTSRTSSSMLPGRHGRMPVGRHRISRRRSGSRSVRATVPERR